MFFEFLKAKGMCGYIIFVVGIFFYPDIGYRHRQGSIRARPGSNPFICHVSGGIVAIGVNIDLFLPLLPEPDTPDSRFLSTVNPIGGIGVISPLYYQLRIF
ncbi:hypothetical protein ES703_70394 [subsurface metagenome]